MKRTTCIVLWCICCSCFNKSEQQIHHPIFQKKIKTDTEKVLKQDNIINLQEAIIDGYYLIKKTEGDFYIKKTEVTQKEWEEIMGYNPSFYKDCGEDCPVEQIGWHDGIIYMNKLSDFHKKRECYRISSCRKIDGINGRGESVSFQICDSVIAINNCNGFRYPTASEWDFVANDILSGRERIDANKIAWHSSNSDRTTHQVALKEGNIFNLYDLAGNVAEWVWDEKINESKRIERVRKGCWINTEFDYYFTIANNSNLPHYGFDFIGIRPVLNK